MSCNTYHTSLLLSDENNFFLNQILVLAVLRQAALLHVANTVRDTVLTVRNVHMKIIEDYNIRW